VVPSSVTSQNHHQSTTTEQHRTNVHGQHNHMKCLFATLGCAVMAHVKPKSQQTWDIHADTGFNIGTAMEHHQCFHIYIVKTRAIKVSDTVFFKHQYITNPPVTTKTLVIKGVSELTSALNSLPTKSVLGGEKLVLFGRCVLNYYVGIVHYILREMKTWGAKIYLLTTHKLANIN
jgi:hypothetical protein